MPRISLYIPYVFKNIKRHNIISTFNLLKLGGIERIDLISSKFDHQQAFVHMYNFNDQKYPHFRSRLNKGETIRIVYDDPWFWKVCKSRSPKPPTKVPKWPHIIFETKGISPLGAFHPTNKLPDQGCGLWKPIKWTTLEDWGPAEFAIGRH